MEKITVYIGSLKRVALEIAAESCNCNVLDYGCNHCTFETNNVKNFYLLGAKMANALKNSTGEVEKKSGER